MSKTHSFYSTALSVGCVLVILVTLCRCAMLGTAYDYEMHFFTVGLPLRLFGLLTAVTVLFAFSGLVLFRKSAAGGEYPPPSSAETLFSALCGFFLLATVIMQGIYAASGLEIGRYTVKNSWFLKFWEHLRTGAPIGGSDPGQTLQFLALVLAIPGGIYFLYTAFLEKPKRVVRAVLGFFFLVWTALCLLVVNFDMTLPINSPERLGPITAFLSAMLFATAEIRYLLGKGKLSLLFAAGMLTMLFCFSDAMPTVLYAFAGRLSMGISTIYACAELSISLYALLRLRSLRRRAEGKDSETALPGPAGSETLSKERGEEVRESEGVRKIEEFQEGGDLPPFPEFPATEPVTEDPLPEWEDMAEASSPERAERVEIFPLVFPSAESGAEPSEAPAAPEAGPVEKAAVREGGSMESAPSSAEDAPAPAGKNDGAEPRRRPTRVPRL